MAKQKFTLLRLFSVEYRKKETWEQKSLILGVSLRRFSGICVSCGHPQYPGVLVVAGGLGEKLEFSMKMLGIREYSIKEVEGEEKLPFPLPNF